MDEKQAIKQLESLKEHCQSMKSSDFNIWTQDIEALEFAINTIKQMEQSKSIEIASFNPYELRQMTFKESKTKDCPQLILLTKGAKTELDSNACGKEWFAYCKGSDIG